jgi:hypothetical protein
MLAGSGGCRMGRCRCETAAFLDKRSLLAKAHSCTLGQHHRCLSVCRSSDRLEARWQQPRAVLQVQAESQKPAGRGVLRIRRWRMVWG